VDGKRKIRVAVVFGGRGPEHPISCLGGGNVLRAIDRDKYEVIPIGIAGFWFLEITSLMYIINVLNFFKRNARMVSRVGGVLLVVVGLLEVTGAWTAAITWLKDHWFDSYIPSL